MSNKLNGEILSPPFRNRNLLNPKANTASGSEVKTLHNKVDLFNSQVLKSNISKLKISLNEKNKFLSKYDENKIKKFNDFVFDANINYDIENSKLEKISNVKGVNWNIIEDNLNVEKNKGLEIIKLKKSSERVSKFKDLEQNPKIKKANFPEDKKAKAKSDKKIDLKPIKLISDRKVFSLNFLQTQNDKITMQAEKDKLKDKNVKFEMNSKNLFISHFLHKVDSPSPRKKLKKISFIEYKEDLDENQKFSLNEHNLDCTMEAKNSFELDKTYDNNLINYDPNEAHEIKSKQFKEAEKEKNEAMENEEFSLDKKNSSMDNKTIIHSLDKSKNEIGESNRHISLNFEEKLNCDKNINNLYLNDYLAKIHGKNMKINSRGASEILKFNNINNIKNSLFGSININNFDLTKKENKELIANRIQSHFLSNKLKLNNNKINSNNSSIYNTREEYFIEESILRNINNSEIDSKYKNEDLILIQMHNEKNAEMKKYLSSDILDNINSNIKKEDLDPKQESVTGKNSKKRNLLVNNQINCKSEKKVIIKRKFIKSNENVLPILNKISTNQKSCSPTNKSILNTNEKAISPFEAMHKLYKNDVKKNNILPTLSRNKVSSLIGSNPKNNNSSLCENQNVNNNKNSILNKLKKEKNENNESNENIENNESNENNENMQKTSTLISLSNSNSFRKSCSSKKSYSRTAENKTLTKHENNEEDYSERSLETFSDSEELKDKFEENFDFKVLDQLRKIKNVTIRSPKKNQNKRKFTIYDKNILKFFDKEIRDEQYDKEVENIYAKIFGQNLEKILELRKYPARIENQTKSNKNIERRKFSKKNYVNKYICDMKEKIHFMKGILDYSYSRVITDKVRLLADMVKKTNLKKKLKNIKNLNENEIQEVLQYFNDLKNLNVGELVTDSESDENENKIGNLLLIS